MSTISQRVHLAMHQQSLPCRDGECDDDGRCKRHARFDAARGMALMNRWRTLAMVRAVMAVEAAKQALPKATAAYYERGSESNLAALTRAKAALEAAQQQRAQAGRWLR